MINYDDFLSIKVQHVPALYSEQQYWVSYKNISINLILSEIVLEGDWLQFGVFKGQTAKILESYILPGRKLHLFDSFEGLPESWINTPYKKGHFSVEDDGMPVFDSERTVIHKGWFSDTVPSFVKDFDKKIPFIHLDADLYSSTLTVLTGLNDLITRGTILLFDEFFMPSKDGVSDDECRALYDWAKSHNREFQILWRTKWVQCAVKIVR